MNSQNSRLFKLLFLIPFLLLISSCTAGDPQFTQENTAGFCTVSGMESSQ